MGDSDDEAKMTVGFEQRFHGTRKDILMGARDKNTPLYVNVHPHQPWVVFIAQGRSVQVWNCEEGRGVKAWDIARVIGRSEAAKIVARQNRLFIVLRKRNCFLMCEVQGQNWELQQLKSVKAHRSRVEDVLFHPTLSSVITYSVRSVKLWNWTAGWVSKTFKCESGKITAAAFHPQESEIVFASASRDRKIIIWNGATSSPTRILDAQYKMTTLQFSANHEKPYLVAGSSVGTIEVFNYVEGRRLATLAGLTGSICSVFFHPQSPYIFAASMDGTIVGWRQTEESEEDYNIEQEICYASGLNEVCSMAPCGNSGMLVVGGRAEFVVLDVVQREVEEETPELLVQQALEKASCAQEILATSLTLSRRAVKLQAEKTRRLEVEAAVMKTRISEMEEASQRQKQRIEQLESCQSNNQAPQGGVLATASGVGNDSERINTHHFQEYSVNSLHSATNNFNENMKLGEGDHGCVFYQGKFQQQIQVLMKKPKVKIEFSLFDRELVGRLRSLRHPHLLRLLGVCYEENCLVYEHMANGNLRDFLTDHGESSPRRHLPWYVRLRVVREIAEALFFLHSNKSSDGRPEPIVHCAIKPANILLDGEFMAKLSGVDCALLLPKLAALNQKPELCLQLETGGRYIAPEYLQVRAFNEKTDIYAFGITLLEMLTGKCQSSAEPDQEVLDNMVKHDNILRNSLDPSAGSWDIELARELAKLGLACASLERRQRPDKGTILGLLEGIAFPTGCAGPVGGYGRPRDDVELMIRKTKAKGRETAGDNAKSGVDEVVGMVRRREIRAPGVASGGAVEFPRTQPVLGMAGVSLVTMWSLGNAQEEKTLELQRTMNGTGVMDVALTKAYFAILQEHAIEVWATSTDNLHWKIETPAKNSAIEFCRGPNKSLLAVGDRNGTLHVWDYETRTRVATSLKGHEKEVHAIAWFDYIFSASKGGEIVVWDESSYQPIQRYSCGLTYSTKLALAPCGDVLPSALIVGDGSGVVVLDIKSQTRASTMSKASKEEELQETVKKQAKRIQELEEELKESSVRLKDVECGSKKHASECELMKESIAERDRKNNVQVLTIQQLTTKVSHLTEQVQRSELRTQGLQSRLEEKVRECQLMDRSREKHKRREGTQADRIRQLENEVRGLKAQRDVSIQTSEKFKLRIKEMERIKAEMIGQLENEVHKMKEERDMSIESFEISKLRIKELERTKAERIEQLENEVHKMREERDMSIETSEKCKLRIKELGQMLAKEVEEKETLQRLLEQIADTEAGGGVACPLREWTFEELQAATHNFDENHKLGQGDHYGCLYQARLSDITSVTVRKLRDDVIMENQRTVFKTAVVDKLRSLRHPHMMTLLGVCTEKPCLVYEHVANGNLEDWISASPTSAARGRRSLPWYSRLCVMAEVAQALCFLHCSELATDGPIIHSAIKPANIFLDINFAAKLGGVDQGLLIRGVLGGQQMAAEVLCLSLRNNYQYMAPELFQSESFDEKTDIYALGITLLQMLTGHFHNALRTIRARVENLNAFENALDSSAGCWDVELAQEVARLGLRCASLERNDRPNMMTGEGSILKVLEGVAANVQLTDLADNRGELFYAHLLTSEKNPDAPLILEEDEGKLWGTQEESISDDERNFLDAELTLEELSTIMSNMARVPSALDTWRWEEGNNTGGGHKATTLTLPAQRANALPASVRDSDKSLLAVGDNYGMLHVWDYETKICLATTMKGHEKGVKNIVWSHYIFSASEDGKIVVWNESNYQPIQYYFSGWNGPPTLALAPCSDMFPSALIVGGEGGVVVLDIRSQTQAQEEKELKETVKKQAERIVELEKQLEESTLRMMGRSRDETQANRIKQLETEVQKLKTKRDVSNKTFPPQAWTAEDLQAATDNFDASHKFGEGDYGCLYQAFKTEVVDRLSALRHPHVMTLLGVCEERHCLVYKHVANGSLEDWISASPASAAGGRRSLPWYSRLRVMAEVAQALCFLHCSELATGGPIIHSAIKPANIFLDSNFGAKLGGVDQGLLIRGVLGGPEMAAEVLCLSLRNNYQYMAPELFQSENFDEKADIYALGITLLQVLTGQFHNALRKIRATVEDPNAFKNALDSNAGCWDVELAQEVARLGVRCTSLERNDRPSMMTGQGNILEILDGVAVKLHLPDSADNGGEYVAS
ncbi:hypothetical protein CBR_g36730 [Chara braunii]|uniref:Protein kinase domain-containing protein n=1 Tax=Chara braunii TaxID=69332 RepID=A0A388LLM1_CHABU|nr:hypothetical protein CBR_g36730 [Chara braunii]|eukprot:GBG83112.1 hypothetical protein CBR_g36730 [Chara braunii]